MPIQHDDDWDNRKAFPDCQEWYANCHQHSLSFSRSVHIYMDNEYGAKPRNRIDILPGEPNLPTLFHIHGGYWQWNNKEDYFCVGEAAHRLGLNTAYLEHTQAPYATLDEIVAETIAGLSWLRENHLQFGIKNSDIFVSGHSSGGHLAAMCQGEPNVIGVLLISGIYDLRPITEIYVNDILSMDEEMAKRNSPALDPKRYSSFSLIAYGEQELTAFQQQSRDYHKILTNEGVDAALLPVSNRNHFNVLDELINEDGAIFRALINWVNLA